MSFYSGRLYVDVAKRWKGFGILYLLLVMSVATIPLSIRLIYDFNDYLNQNMIIPINKLPQLVIQNGEVQFNKPMPYLIKNDKGQVVDIIDTTGKITSFTDNYPNAVFLLLKNKIVTRMPPFKTFLNSTSNKVTIKEQNLNPNDNEIFVGKDWLVTGKFTKLNG